MINLPRLVRMASVGEFGRMLDEVERNGRPLSLRFRMRLADGATLPGAALGLALQRVVELTYRPTPASISLLEALLARAEPDGSFGSVSGTAVALAALHSVIDQVDALPGGKREGGAGRFIDVDLLHSARRAAEAAAYSLAMAQFSADSSDEAAGAIDGLVGDEVDSTIVLWQLGLDPRFTQRVRYDALVNGVIESGLSHDRGARALLMALDAGGSASETAVNSLGAVAA